MAGLTVPRMVPATNTSFLRDLGQKIGHYREDSAISDIMRNIDPADPNSLATTIQKLQAFGGPNARDMADRLQGALNQQQQRDLQGRQVGVSEGTLGLAREKYAGEQAEKTREEERAERFGRQAEQFGRQNPIPSEEQPGPPPPAPTRLLPSGQRSGVFSDGANDAATPRAPDTTTEAAAAAAGPVSFGEAARPVPGANANVARGMLGTQPLQPLPPPPARPPLSGTGAAVPPAPPPSPVGAVGAAPTAAPTLPAVPIPLRAGAGPQVAQTGSAPPVDFSDLVSQRSPPVPPPTPVQSSAELTRQIQALSAMNPRTTQQQKWQEREIKLRQDELKNRTDRQNDAHKAAIEERKGRLGKDTEHAFKRADKVSEQALKDNEVAAAIAQQKALIKEGIVTGRLSNTMKWTTDLADTASQIITKMGGDPDSYEMLKKARDTGAAMTLFNGLAAKSLHGILGGFGQGITNVEGARLDAIVAGLPKDLAGNVRLLEYGETLISARRAGAKAVQDYLNERYRAGVEPVASHIDEIQRRYADRAIAQIEASTPKAAAPAAPATAASPAPAARGGSSGAPAVGEVRNGRPYLGGPLNDPKSWGPRAPGPGGA